MEPKWFSQNEMAAISQSSRVDGDAINAFSMVMTKSFAPFTS